MHYLQVSAVVRLFLALWLAITPTLAWAGSLPLLGAGGGAAVTYTGPGDTFATSPYAAYSCSEAFTAAYAASLGAACDVVDTSTGAITCTYHFQANGLVNPTECNTAGKSCQTACSVTKAYDQTGNGRDVIQATLANMPGLTFSSTPLGILPAIDCNLGTNPVLATSGTVTQAQPLAFQTVYIRSTGTSAGGAVGGNTNIIVGAGSGANLALVQSGSGLTAAAADAAWHVLNGLLNGGGTASAINVDGSDTTGAAGATGFSANNIRLCRATAAPLTGRIAEAAIWATTTTSTNRNSLSANAHSAGRYNF